MGYDVDAFIAKPELLKLLARPIAPLAEGLGLVPWTALPDDKGRELSQQGRIAFMTAGYFGGEGTQAAKVWEHGALIYDGDSVNRALALLGVVTRDLGDEWDTVGLGECRSNEAWMAKAALSEAGGFDDFCRLLTSAEQSRVRSAAASRLAQEGPRAIAPLLVARAKDPDYGVRLSSVMALAELQAVGELCALLDGDELWGVVFALGKLGEAARPALPRLIELLNAHPDWQVRIEVVRTIAVFSEGRFALERATQDSNDLVRKAAADALQRSGTTR